MPQNLGVVFTTTSEGAVHMETAPTTLVAVEEDGAQARGPLDLASTEFEFRVREDVHVRLKGREGWIDQQLEKIGPLLSQLVLTSSPPRIDKAPKIDEAPADSTETSAGVSKEAMEYLRQQNVPLDLIMQVYHFEDGDVTLIAPELPGASVKQRTINAYLLAGFQEFLKAGRGAFPDQIARDLCQRYGSFDKTNHATYLKSTTSLLIGSKADGFQLTMPGRRQALRVIEEAAATQIA